MFGLMSPKDRGNPTATLAAELAAKLLPIQDILERNGVTKTQLQAFMQDPQFRHMVKEFRREWNSPLSAKERVKVKSSLLVEDGLIQLNTMFYDDDLQPSARLDAYEKLVKLADMQPKRDEVSPTGGFSISINIPQPEGAEPKAVTLEHTPDAEV